MVRFQLIYGLAPVRSPVVRNHCSNDCLKDYENLETNPRESKHPFPLHLQQVKSAMPKSCPTQTTPPDVMVALKIPSKMGLGRSSVGGGLKKKEGLHGLWLNVSFCEYRVERNKNIG